MQPPSTSTYLPCDQTLWVYRVQGRNVVLRVGEQARSQNTALRRDRECRHRARALLSYCRNTEAATERAPRLDFARRSQDFTEVLGRGVLSV